jgi:hypothetical protein
MTISTALTSELKLEVETLQDDLRDRLATLPETLAAWKDEYQRAVARRRTGQTWTEWSEDRLIQAAVAWILTTVFVRFCEDNRLVEPVWFAGPRSRWDEASEAQAAFIRSTAKDNPDVTERDWLLHAVDHLRGLKSTQALVDEQSPLWLIAPSGDAAAHLIAFWREKLDSGGLRHDFTDSELDTRFLGDLYQDLSDRARAQYALLQTPIFVEELILDLTLTPALRSRSLDGLKIIDPTCGSGHFLLSAFDRVLDRWHREAPAINERELVQRALDSIHGVDLNPFAIAIARFRLTVAAVKASGLKALEDAPAFRFHLAVGDSLLHGRGGSQQFDFGLNFVDDQESAAFTYATENYATLREILVEGRYDVVVGNPPYITMSSDKTLNLRYRELYNYCKGTYALTVPFMERFFALAKAADEAGWVGQITSNSFMKREFGAPIIEDFLTRTDLTHVIDTSGAYIPGHGTPTVIVAGRNRPIVGPTVRAVLGVRGEPGRPDDPAKGKVWSSIAEHLSESAYEDDWITVTDLDRKHLARHPWSLAGGGAIELKDALETRAQRSLDDLTAGPTGGSVRAGADEAFVRPWRLANQIESLRPLVVGDEVRDWANLPTDGIIYPYVYGTQRTHEGEVSRILWSYRSLLAARRTFQGDMADAGYQWWQYMQHTASPYKTPLSITFAEVATHNHFVLDRGGNVFKQTAPVIKLPQESAEDDHLELLAVLNSSAACFWFKQVCYPKGGDKQGNEGARVIGEAWEDRYQHNGLNVQDLPLPSRMDPDIGRLLDMLAREQLSAQSSVVGAGGVPTSGRLQEVQERSESVRRRMIGIQEELDWGIYCAYGLVEECLTSNGNDVPELVLGERAFEIVLARQVAAGLENTAWFIRHGSTPRTDLPCHWPAAYRELVEKRIALIEQDRFIRLLERPEYKRRWATESWEKKEERALREWLLDRLEDKRFWFDKSGRPTPRSIATLADVVSRDEELTGVLALWEGRPDVAVLASLEKLLTPEAVPFLAAYRYKESGLRTRAEWERVWDLQRKEDAKSYVADRDGALTVPPKYKNADFVKADYWRHRGKLDVPKERFIAYPQAGRETDPSLVIGWAGWDHAQQSLALATLLQQRETEGAADDRLKPLAAGLVELLPWVEQWHSGPDPLYGGGSPSEFFTAQVDSRAAQLGMTPQELSKWRPPKAARGRRAKTAS